MGDVGAALLSFGNVAQWRWGQTSDTTLGSLQALPSFKRELKDIRILFQGGED